MPLFAFICHGVHQPSACLHFWLIVQSDCHALRPTVIRCGWSLRKTSELHLVCALQHARDQEAGHQQRLRKAWAAPPGATPVEPADLGLHPPDTAEARAQRQQELEAVLAEAQALTGLPITLVDAQGEAPPAPAAAG